MSTFQQTNARPSYFHAELRKLARAAVPVVILALPVVATVGFVLAFRGVSDSALEAANKTELSRETVNEWLEEQRKGRDGLRYWSEEDWVRPSTLFAVRSWEIVDNSGARITVRVDSSNRAGQPIIKLWDVSLHDDANGSGKKRIYWVREKESSLP